MQVNSTHVELLNVMGEYAGKREPTLYYPGSSYDESPEHTSWYAEHTIYVDLYDEASIRLHQALGRTAFVADATDFTPAVSPDAIVFFNPTGINIGETVIRSGLKDDGLVGYASWDQHQINRENFDASGLELRGVITDGRIDTNVEDYLPIEDDTLLRDVFPDRYDAITQSVRAVGISDEVIKEHGLIKVVALLKEQAHRELVASGFTMGGRWILRYDLDIPSVKETGYGLVIAQKATN